MDLWIVIVLGIVEGLTEFIPVSSTGHLILVGSWLGLKGEHDATFQIFIQLGAICAVLWLYRRRFLLLFKPSSGTSGLSGRDGLIKIGVACLPALVLGALFHKVIKQYLFGNTTVAWALVIGGCLMILVEAKQRKITTETLDQVSLSQAFIVGCFQCLALWPGFSRSGSTIIGGLLSGINRSTAAEFSFLVAVPIMCAATCFDLLKSISVLSSADVVPFALGFLVSFLSGIVAIRFFMVLLSKWTLRPFAYYRIVLGLVLIGLSN